jgi:hypothetical protein
VLQELVLQVLREYKALLVLALMVLQVFKDQPVRLELLVPQVPRVLVLQALQGLPELLAQLELMVPQVLPELVLLELLAHKAQLGQVASPALQE